MFVRYDPDFARELTEIDPNQRRIEDSLALRDAEDENFGLNKVEILEGNIGYLPVYNFTSFTELARPSFVSALRFLSRTRALIIDMRYNGEVARKMVSQLGSYFLCLLGRRLQRLRTGSGIPRMCTGPIQPRQTACTCPCQFISSLVTALFRPQKTSSYSMQQAKRALIVGDTTGGGAHPWQGQFQLGQDF